jgi:hypothetical protein
VAQWQTEKRPGSRRRFNPRVSHLPPKKAGAKGPIFFKKRTEGLLNPDKIPLKTSLIEMLSGFIHALRALSIGDAEFMEVRTLGKHGRWTPCTVGDMRSIAAAGREV